MWLARVRHVLIPLHSISLSRSCLSVGKNCRVKSLNYLLDVVLNLGLFKNRRLTLMLSEHLVKAEAFVLGDVVLQGSLIDSFTLPLYANLDSLIVKSNFVANMVEIGILVLESKHWSHPHRNFDIRHVRVLAMAFGFIKLRQKVLIFVTECLRVNRVLEDLFLFLTEGSLELLFI